MAFRKLANSIQIFFKSYLKINYQCITGMVGKVPHPDLRTSGMRFGLLELWASVSASASEGRLFMTEMLENALSVAPSLSILSRFCPKFLV